MVICVYFVVLGLNGVCLVYRSKFEKCFKAIITATNLNEMKIETKRMEWRERWRAREGEGKTEAERERDRNVGGGEEGTRMQKKFTEKDSEKLFHQIIMRPTNDINTIELAESREVRIFVVTKNWCFRNIQATILLELHLNKINKYNK